MAYYLHPDDWLWLIRNAGSLYAGVYNKFLPQNIISKLKRNYVLNTPSVNLNCCCTPGPIAIGCQMSSPNPILAFSIDPDSVQCSRICRGWEQSSSSSGLSESCTLCKQSSKAAKHDFPLPHVQECPQVCNILVGLTCLSELQSRWW